MSDATARPEFSYAPQHLPSRAALAVEGADTLKFLNNLLTVDLTALQSGQAAYGALLTPQGKILFDLFLLRTDAGFLVDCAATQRAELVARLTLYKMRAAVTLSLRDDLEIVVSSSELAVPFAYADPRVSALGWRGFAPKGSFAAGMGYDAARIAIGLADSDADIGSGKLFPHEANFEQFGAVSFAKGCYVGQEVVSRMQHRGLARSRILPVTLSGPLDGTEHTIMSGESVVGEVLSHLGLEALALLRLDRLAGAQAPLLTGAVRVRVVKPFWITYPVVFQE